MGTWSAWLMALATPLVSRVLIALGFAYVTHEAVKGLMISVLQEVATSFGGLPADVTALLARAGFFLALSIWSGGIIGGLTYGLARKLTVVNPQEAG
jgi:hypothetical protein